MTWIEGLVSRVEFFDLEMSRGGLVGRAATAKAILLVICLEVVEVVGCSGKGRTDWINLLSIDN